MSKNLQFLDDPDDVPSINESITLHIGVNGSDFEGDGSASQPFRSLGKAMDVVRTKFIKSGKMVTLQLGSVTNDRYGRGKKYFEEDEIKIDFESAKRLKIKGQKPTDHEVVAISYYDKAPDREGYYCQILVTNHDKISIGDYIGIYDHYKAKKKNPSYFWVANNIGNPIGRMLTPNNCYVDAIRGEMIVGVHEVVDISDSIDHAVGVLREPTEIFEADGLKVGAVTLHVKNHNHTYNRLNEVPYWNTLGTVGGDPIFTYAAGGGNSPLQGQQNNVIPPILYGADMLSNPQTAESNGYQQFYYSNPVMQIELVDIMVRGYQFPLTQLDGKIVDPRTGVLAPDASLLWNDKTLTGTNRAVVAIGMASFFYKKIISDLRIDSDLPFYFGKSSDPFVRTSQLISAAKKIRDYLLAGAKQLNGIPPWDEDNHPGYGFGPFNSAAVVNPSGSGAPVDKTSYPKEYADSTKFSILLRYHNLYPPVNGQMYQPTLIKRIKSWYNDNGSKNGVQLDRWEGKGNRSPFFCGYITPQGWYKQRYATNPSGTSVSINIPTLTDITVPNSYGRLLGTTYPSYVGNTASPFSVISDGTRGTPSNDRDATRNLFALDYDSYRLEAAGLTSNTDLPNSFKESMGARWYSGSVNSMGEGEGSASLSVIGGLVFDRYSFGYRTGTPGTTADFIQDKITPIPGLDVQDVEPITDTQSINLRAKCFKSVLRFAGRGIKVTSKTKLGLIMDVCLVNLGTQKQGRGYGILADGESIINGSCIAVSGFDCGISSRNQSLVNLLADLGDSSSTSNNFFSPISPAAFTTCNEIGIESTLKSHVNSQRSVSSGSKKANYLCIASSSMNCSNSLSVGSHRHGFVCEFGSYMRATNCFAEFNGGIGFVSANNSILVCHRGRSIWNGSHGLMATTKSTARCYEFIARSNDGDGIVAKTKSTVAAGANSGRYPSYRNELLATGLKDNSNNGTYNGAYAFLPPHLYQVTVVPPDPIATNIRLPRAAISINANPTHDTNIMYHECNSTISEFNAGSGFASEMDSTVVADNTIARYNSKKYGEFFIYGWSGIRGAFPTDTFTPFEGNY